jgi:hypothetical protein
MAKVEEHCEDCKRELGDRFLHVNEWLDELFTFVGADHRDIRHHDKGVEKVRKMWGDLAAKAAEIHIKRDCHGSVPKVDKVFMTRMAFKPHIYQAFLKEYEDE